MPHMTRLPEDVQSQIKSSVEIRSMIDVVDGLVKNAIDSDASWIDISLDLVKGYCSVRDDGIGIPRVEFTSSGHLGELYCRCDPDLS